MSKASPNKSSQKRTRAASSRLRNEPDPVWVGKVTDAVLAHRITDFSLARLAALLDVSAAALIYQFQSQDRLREAVLRELGDRDVTHLRQLAESNNTLQQVVAAYTGVYLQSADAYQARTLMAGRIELYLQDALSGNGDFTQGADSRWHAALSRIVERDGFAPEHVPVIAEYLLTSMRGMGIQFAVCGDRQALIRTEGILLAWYGQQLVTGGAALSMLQ